MRFLGNSEARTDAKGRVFLPAIFRKQLKRPPKSASSCAKTPTKAAWCSIRKVPGTNR